MADNLTELNQGIQPPPEPELAIRTMESDIKSLKQSGGQAPSPEFLNLPYKVKAQPREGEELIGRNGTPNIKGYSGPEKGIFEPGATVRVESRVNQTKPNETPQVKKSGIGKTIFIALLILLGCAALGFAGYYIVITYFIS